MINEIEACLKRDRLISSNDVSPQKRKTCEKLDTLIEAIKINDQSKIDECRVPRETQITQVALEDACIY